MTPVASRKTRGVLLGAILAAAVSVCSSPAAPEKSARPPPYEPAPTVAVTNPLCDGGGCDSVVVSMFVWAYLKYIPENPLYGAWLGIVRGRTGCIQIPGLDSVKVGIQDSTETPRDVHTYYWRPDDPDGIELILSIWGDRPHIADTRTFIPADARGWDLTFTPDPDSASDGRLYIGHLAADSVACTPPS